MAKDVVEGEESFLADGEETPSAGEGFSGDRGGHGRVVPRRSLSTREGRYIALRVRGMEPFRAVLTLDQEDQVERSVRKRQAEAARLESLLVKDISEALAPEEMSDIEWERYEGYAMQRIAMAPKDSAAYAVTALKEIGKRRMDRHLSDPGALKAWMDEVMTDLVEVGKVETWVEGHLGTAGGSQGAGCTAGLLTGQAGNGGLGGHNPGRSAILAALLAFRDRERELMGVLNDSIGKLEGTTDDDSLAAGAPAPA